MLPNPESMFRCHRGHRQAAHIAAQYFEEISDRSQEVSKNEIDRSLHAIKALADHSHRDTPPLRSLSAGRKPAEPSPV